MGQFVHIVPLNVPRALVEQLMIVQYAAFHTIIKITLNA